MVSFHVGNRARRAGIGLLAAALIGVPGTTLADGGDRKATEVLDDLNVTLGGQIRLRPEVDARDFNEDTQADTATSSRVRLQLGVAPMENIRAFIQLQDVRVFGEESDTLTDADADGFDMHQGYIVVDDLLGTGLQLQAGRQEVNLGEQRLVGAVGWTQNARSLDGALVTAAAGNVGSVTGFAFTLDEDDAIGFGGDLRQLNPNVDEGVNDDMWLAGVHSQLGVAPTHTIEPHVYFLKDGETNLEHWTVGIYAHGSVPMGDDALVYNGTFDYQTGNVDDAALGELDISAFLFAGHVGYKTGPFLATIGYEYLSGDDDPTDDDVENFDTLLATNHKFYGHMDYFLNNAGNTAALGLQDIVLKLRFPVIDGVKGALDIHHFMTAEDDPARLNGEDEFGQEIDLWFNHAYNKFLALTAGYSLFVPGKAMEARFADNDDLGHWAYLMADFKF